MPSDYLDHYFVRAFWEERSREQPNRWTSAEMLSYELSFLRRLVPAPQSILDLGCGSGELSLPLAEDGALLVAVDFAPSYRQSFRGALHEFVECSLSAFDTARRFDLVLLFGVVTSLDLADEIPIFRKMADWLTADGVAVVKHQCAVEQEFIRTGWSEALGSNYSGRYPNAAEQADRLREVFPSVQEHPYPDRFNRWDDSFHVAFVCRGRRE